VAQRVVLDTNVFVAAGFARRSSSRGILDRIRDGRVRLVVDRATRRETERILRKIPPLSARSFVDVFDAAEVHEGKTRPEEFGVVRDPDDRKFAALAAAAGAVLVTNDDDLLSVRDRLEPTVRTPSEFLASDEAG